MMDFYTICAKAKIEENKVERSLKSYEVRLFLSHLKDVYPYGEHADLTPSEIQTELEKWIMDLPYL